jgi:L-Ala-D/L-Glu epimerase
MLTCTVSVDRFATEGAFTISRGSRREAVVVVATITDGQHIGRGEATPYARYGETIESVVAAIESQRARLDRLALQTTMLAGAARNALDCALWDLAAKRSRRTVAALAGLPEPQALLTAYTLSLAPPDVMAAKARAHADKPLLKLKLGGPDDVARLQAVRNARPDARIIVDANEGWTADVLPRMLKAAALHGVELIEQPVAAGQDALLADVERHVPLCADESLHTRDSLAAIAGLYDAVNIKLDKTGGLTEALAVRDAARALGLRIMVGCMLASSLAMAPAVLVAQGADWCDFDGPLLLAADRTPGIVYQGARLVPPPASLWG